MRAKTATTRRHARTVAIVVYDGLSMFEFAVAHEFFGPHSWLGRDVSWYRLLVCAPVPGAVTTDTGLRIDAPYGLDGLRGADTVVVPPCDREQGVPEAVTLSLRRAHRRGARIVSLCTGAFVLAEAGLLNGRRVTTHWAECDELARRYPQITVDPDVLYVDSGDVLTSAGSAASIDLCLHLVRKDHGAQLATSLARQLVVPPYRDGGQAQYIDTPIPQATDADLFSDTMAWVQTNLDQAITIADLADRSAMSRRTFARRFLAATGTSPYQWLLRQRIQLSQRLLETTDLPIELVARRSGMVTAGNLRKHFSRAVLTTPQNYRRTFRESSAASAIPTSA